MATFLHELYDLWEIWVKTAGLTKNQQDAAIRGDGDAETAAALVHARGSKTHAHVEFGDYTDTYSDNYYDHYGCWRWQAHSDPKFPQRDQWYALRVANQEVMGPVEAAVRWFQRVVPVP